jgi:hypothetical protein
MSNGNGARMTPSHAAKDGKRYRYYLSNNLIAGRGADPGNGLRIPAHEVEGHVVTAVCRFLSDAQRLTNQICTSNEAPSVMNAIMRKAREHGQTLATETGSDRYQAIRELISDVHIVEDGIRVVLNRQSIQRRLGIACDEETDQVGHEQEENAIVLDIPAELRRLGKEKRLIVPTHAPETNPDRPLIKAIVRAHQWFEMLKSRNVMSITDIARAEKLPRTYISSLLPLVFLAPDITEAILGGRQPMDVTLDRMLKLAPLALVWAAQRQELGIAGR